MADGEQQKKQEEGGKAGEDNNKDVLERTVFVENLRTSVEKLAKILKPIYSEKYGEDAVVALVRKRDGYEITFSTAEAARECLDTGFQVDRRQYDAVSVSNTDLLVNLTSVPAYVDDAAIVKKLTDMGVTSVGEIKHQKIEGVETGRRKVLIQLPSNMRSLPRGITVKSAIGRDERIEVFHRNQRLRKNTR